MSEEQTQPVEDTTQAPPELDPYFVKEGKAFTGTGDPVDIPGEPPPEDPEKQAAQPEKTDPAKPEKKKPTAAETWKAIRQREKEQAQREHELQQLQEQAQADREAAAAEREEMKTNFRGWLKKQNLSLKDIIEEDLREQDVDPVQKKFSELEAQNKALMEKLEALLNKDQLASQEMAARQDIDALTQHAQTVAEEYPLVATRIEKLAPRMRDAYYAHKQATGQKPTMDMLFSHFEKELTDLGLTAPSPSQSSVATKKPLPPARGKGAVKSAVRASEGQETDDGVDSDGPASLTNRQTAVRATNGRKATREEHLSRAASLIQFRNS